MDRVRLIELLLFCSATALLGWIAGAGGLGAAKPVKPATQPIPTTIQQAPTGNILYRDKRMVLYFLCDQAGGRFVLLDFGQQYLHGYQAGGCAPEVW